MAMEQDNGGNSRHEVNNPHDSFFRDLGGEPRVYRSLIREKLPEKVLRHLDLRTLKPIKTHFVDERLRHLYSDCLYTVRLREGGAAHVYVLVEHQSTSDYWMPFRIWQYIFAAWDDVKRQADGKQVKLPLIIPLVVYSGAKAYHHSMDLRDLIDASHDLIDMVLYKPAGLHDLTLIDDEEIKADAYLGTMLLTLKHAYDEAMPYDRIFVQLSGIGDEKLRKRFLLAVLRYIFSVRDDADEHKLKDLVTKRLAEAGDVVMTLAERLEKRGEKIGEKRGKREGVLTVAVNFLKSGFDEKVVAENTGLPLDEVRQLKLEHRLS
jgi:predicted transposase/invertase (TIGR01784 family)